MFKELFGRRPETGFKTRCPERERGSDEEAIGRVAEAIDTALTALQAEQSGLSRRVEEAVTTASLAVGNESDEYLSREPAKAAALRSSEDEMKRGRERLDTLDRQIIDLRFLRAAFLTRFPEYNAKLMAKQSPTAGPGQ